MQKEERERKSFFSRLMSETVISLSDKVCVCVFTLVLGSLKPHLVLCVCVCVWQKPGGSHTFPCLLHIS